MDDNTDLKQKDLFPAEPQEMPELTYWPFAAAFGMFFMLFGILTSWIVSLVGLVLLILSFAGWISDINHDYGSGEERKK